MTSRQRQGAGSRHTATYRALIEIAEEVVANAKAALEKTAKMRGKGLFAAMTIDALRNEIAHYCGLGERVIDQARRRVGQAYASQTQSHSSSHQQRAPSPTPPPARVSR